MSTTFFRIKPTAFLVWLIVCTPVASHGQTLETIEDLKRNAQKHLDEGKNMLRHTSNLYVQMDSLLNVVYKKLRMQLPQKEKEALEQEQFSWLKARDIYFKQLYKDEETESSLKRDKWGEVEYLDIYLKEINYVEDRVVVLVKRLMKER